MFGTHSPDNRLIVNLEAVAKMLEIRESTLLKYARERDNQDKSKRKVNRTPWLARDQWVWHDRLYPLIILVPSRKLTVEKRTTVWSEINSKLAKSLLIAYLNRPLD